MATIPNPITWVAAAVLTAAQLNTNVRDAINFLLGSGANAHPYTFAYQSSGQALVAATLTTAVLDSEVEDSDNIHASTGVFTIVTPGLYHFIAQGSFGGTTFASGNSDQVILAKNGTTVAENSQPANNALHRVQVTAHIRCVATDTITFQLLSTIANTTTPGQGQTFMQGRWVRE